MHHTLRYGRKGRFHVIAYGTFTGAEKQTLRLMAERNAAGALEKRNARQQVHEQRTVGACQELARQFHIQHFCAADQYRVRLIKIIRLSVILSEAVQSDRCNRIQAMILKHNQLFSFSKLSINSTSF